MLALIGFIVVVLWLVGLLALVGGGFIHILLIVGAVMLLMHFMRGRASRI